MKNYILSALSIFIFSLGFAQQTKVITQSVKIYDYTEQNFIEKQLRNWQHKDIVLDTIPGTSIDRLYREFDLNLKDSIIVAIIDSGIDIEHEDLKGQFWVNTKEIAGNGIDDDQNGYIDDIHGWNFLGTKNGQQTLYARKELVRILKNKRYFKNKEKFLAKADTTSVEMAQNYEKQVKTLKEDWDYVTDIENDYKKIRKDLKSYFPNQRYNMEALKDIDTIKHPELSYSVRKLDYYLTYDATLEWMSDYKEYLQVIEDYKLNPKFQDRKDIGDDISDINDRNYGNPIITPKNRKELHGTAVASLIAARRNNDIGMNGVLNNVKLMVLRAVPSGDEYDKDIALAIRYAVDNGARIINMSFGKSYSSYPQMLKEAITYASTKDVLLVHAAGNDSNNVDTITFYPLDYSNEGRNSKKNEFVDNFVNVGAIHYKLNEKLSAYFSNYGKGDVDIFAPGHFLNLALPDNAYSTDSGTSFAAPVVAGIAAILRSQYPALSAAQTKQILLSSGITYDLLVRPPGGEQEERVPFSSLSKSGNVVNAYNAFVMAKEMLKE
ncbi:S8 family serine peptidase [Aquimarina sp. ERC-38]|uniref:S8 family serine peptidase n=1 Tax=Aquimarina sp. ERC-38 TaxID=2949996 RepID=UPI00224580F5|nr:S8 family serine peptidase [Aquimarina sp. ERC-38]UZO81722.1 S8 family serine peptidase [Aquimarina sp. ERC-38]